MGQHTFNPIDYGFSWTTDGWYEWDHKAAQAAALKDRNAEARRLQKEGKTVRKWSMPNQQISRGGVGSGHPHIVEVVTVYVLDVC
jgi:hypothetical protein